MKALIVYESMFGNSRQVGESIRDGLAMIAGSVTLANVNHVNAEVLLAADILVVGGPTHVHGMSRESTRKGAKDQATPELKLEPDAPGTGIRDFLNTLGSSTQMGAAFDTRLNQPQWITGAASHAVARSLSAHGVRLVAKPQSFLVDKATQLLPGELERAREWGEAVGVSARMTGESRSSRHV